MGPRSRITRYPAQVMSQSRIRSLSVNVRQGLSTRGGVDTAEALTRPFYRLSFLFTTEAQGPENSDYFDLWFSLCLCVLVVKTGFGNRSPGGRITASLGVLFSCVPHLSPLATDRGTFARGLGSCSRTGNDLLCAHWPISAECLCPLVPSVLTLDTFGASAGWQ